MTWALFWKSASPFYPTLPSASIWPSGNKDGLNKRGPRVDPWGTPPAPPMSEPRQMTSQCRYLTYSVWELFLIFGVTGCSSTREHFSWIWPWVWPSAHLCVHFVSPCCCFFFVCKPGRGRHLFFAIWPTRPSVSATLRGGKRVAWFRREFKERTPR